MNAIKHGTIFKCTMDIASISDVSAALEKQLKTTKAAPKEIRSTVLLLEELTAESLRHGKTVGIKLQERLGVITLILTCEGEEQNPLALINEWDNDDDLQRLRHTILCTYRERLTYSRRGGSNVVYIKVHDGGKKRIALTFGAMLAGIAFGLLASWLVPSPWLEAVNTNVFTVVRTLFLNALKMMIAPVVFFSIVASICSLTDLSEIGRMAGKQVGLYMVTTLVAIALGFLVANAVFARQQPVESIAAAQTAGTDTVTVSFKDTLTGIIPKDLVTPIQSNNMLQVIFVALLCGIALSILGGKVKLIQELVAQFNTLSTQIISLLMRFVPIVTFCAMASLMISVGRESVLLLAKMLICVMLGTAGMLVVYALLILIVGRLSPVKFLRKIVPFMITPFSLGSSNATIPLSMDFCSNKMGISPKLSSFAIPVGATINMDGTCLFLATGMVMFAKMFGMPIDAHFLFTTAASIFVLSVGAPGVQGAGIICLSTLVATLGLPMEYIGLVIGIDQLMGMLRTVSNVVGDIAVTTTVAQSEKLLDKEVFSA